MLATCKAPMPDELYTRLFVDTPTLDALRASVAALIGGRVHIEGGSIEVDVDTNPYASPPAPHVNTEDFMEFPFTVELFADSSDLESYLAVVAAVMTGLHAQGASVVAACDWESRLPGSGALYHCSPRGS
jgi:hypothetical protein